MDGLIIAAFTFAGGIAGAFIKYLFDRWTSAENARRVRKLELYTSFINIFWQLTEEMQKSDKRNASYEYSKLANEIAMYGSTEVVRSLAPVMRGGRHYDQHTMTELILAMRGDILGERSPALFEPVRTILFDRDDGLTSVPPPTSVGP